MSTTETTTDMRAFEAALDRNLHFYPSLGRRPRPGDVALCGHVKTGPPTPAIWQRATCEACIAIRGRDR